jgi:predicted NBD/HSP70 family sugar kinase
VSTRTERPGGKPGRVNEPLWPLMHAILARGASSPNHAELAKVAEIGERSVGKLVGIFGPSGTGLLSGGHPLRFGPGAGLVLGLSVGSQSVRGGLVDSNGELYCERSADPPVPGQLARDPEALLSAIRRVAAEVLSAGLNDDQLRVGRSRSLGLLGASIAWPSPLNREKRPRGWTLSHEAWYGGDAEAKAPTIPEHLCRALREVFPQERCSAIHDVNAHSLWLGFHQSRALALDADDTDEIWRVHLVLRVGENVAASPMLTAPARGARLSFIDYKLIEGTNGFAGEIGHLSVDKQTIDDVNKDIAAKLKPVPYNSWECSCGRKNHLESFVSIPALLRRLSASGYKVPSEGRERESRVAAARIGQLDDSRPINAGRDIGRILGHALAGPILVLDPTRITLTGPLASDNLVKGVLNVSGSWASVLDDSVDVDLDESGAGDYIGVRGAALAVIRRLVYRGVLDERKPALPKALQITASDVASLDDEGAKKGGRVDRGR